MYFRLVYFVPDIHNVIFVCYRKMVINGEVTGKLWVNDHNKKNNPKFTRSKVHSLQNTIITDHFSAHSSTELRREKADYVPTSNSYYFIYFTNESF